MKNTEHSGELSARDFKALSARPPRIGLPSNRPRSPRFSGHPARRVLLTPGGLPHFTSELGGELQGPKGRGSANICPQRALRDDQDAGLKLLPLPEIPSSPRRPRGLPLPALGGCRLPPTMWPPGASGGRELGGRGPRAAMRPPSTFGHAASDPEGSLR